MFKRMLALLTALLLLSLPANAEDAAYDKAIDALYRLVLRTEAGDVTLGSGVLFIQQNVLLTAEACCREGQLVAIGQDGEHAVQGWELSGKTGIAVMSLATPSTAAPLTLSGYDVPAMPYLFGTDAQHNVGVMSLYQVLQDLYLGHSSLLLSADEGLLPGSVMVDESGAVMALVVAQKAEGMGMYIAHDPSGIYAAISGSDAADAFLPVEASWSEGLLSVSWKDETRQSGLYLVTVSGAENDYYSYFEVDREQRSLVLGTPPGHSYFVQAQWTPSVEEATPPVWSAMSTCTAPMATLTSYGFRQECYLACAPVGTEVTGALPEMTAVTVGALEDPSTALYLQIINTYDVDGEITLPMTLELIAPSGQFYFEESGYLFSPEYEENDVFAVPVDELFETCREFSGNGFLTGEYTLRYAIGGCLAGEYTFSVLPGEAAPQEPQADASSGFLTELSAVNEKGLITVDWANAALPAGARINVFFLHEDNSYYTYHSMEEGATATEFFAVPGRSVSVWATWSTAGDPPHALPERQEELIVVEAMPMQAFTQNSFVNLRCSVTASDDPQAAQKGEYLPVVPLTRELLSGDQPLYFQTEDTYHVAEESGSHPLALALVTPEGLVFVDPGYYTFAPELVGSDLWLKDVSKLFADYESLAGDQPWPDGEYTLLYLIDGQIAGQFIFTLE